MRYLACFLLLACSDSRSLRVDVKTDLISGIEFDHVHVRNVRTAEESTLEASARDWLEGSQVAEWDTSRSVELVEAWLTLGGAQVMRRLVEARVDQRTASTIVFTRSCTGVVCDEGLSCLGGDCVPAGCLTGDEPECGDADCTTASDCGTSDHECAELTCERGVCFVVPRDSFCGSGTCDVRFGCTGMDAGMDAPIDAGMDACTEMTTEEACAAVACGPIRVDGGCGADVTYDCGGCDSTSRCAANACVACTSTCGSDTFQDFERGEEGSVNGYEDWTVGDRCAVYDEAIVEVDGNRVLRMSNAVTPIGFPCFDQVYSPCPAGIPGAGAVRDFAATSPELWAGESTSNAMFNEFHSTFRFRSATGAPQPGLAVEFAVDSGNGKRQHWIWIRDSGTGLEVLDGALRVVATGLSYDAWHTYELVFTFGEGDNDDLTAHRVDGMELLPIIGLEQWFVDNEPENGKVPVQCSLFRVFEPPAPATMGAGLYFDDVATWLEAPR